MLRCWWHAWQEDFLSRLSDLRPDLCITAAYGNILPQAFLDIPRLGTLNIHPSLLPKYRGASPVQRALQVTCLSCHFSALPIQSAQPYMKTPGQRIAAGRLQAVLPACTVIAKEALRFGRLCSSRIERPHSLHICHPRRKVCHYDGVVPV